MLADLEGLAYGLKEVKQALNALRNATINEDADVGLGAEPYDDSFRYVLPVSETGKEAA